MWLWGWIQSRISGELAVSADDASDSRLCNTFTWADGCNVPVYNQRPIRDKLTTRHRDELVFAPIKWVVVCSFCLVPRMGWQNCTCALYGELILLSYANVFYLWVVLNTQRHVLSRLRWRRMAFVVDDVGSSAVCLVTVCFTWQWWHKY